MAAGYTDTDSWGVGILQDAKFAADRWRILGGVAVAVAQYDLYVPEISPDFKFPTQQRLAGGLLQVLRRVAPDLYMGLRYMRATVNFPVPEESQNLIPEEGIDFNIGGLGLVAEWDKRNHSFQPSAGHRALLRTNFSREDFGAEIEYDTVSLAFNHYRTGFRAEDVFAWRASVCGTSTDTPFFERCQFGSSKDLRGYAVGRYYNDAMYAAQIEYRAPVWKRLGAVAFAGVGSIADSFSDLTSSTTLPAGGVGLRFLASAEQRLNLSLDFAVGRDESTWYMYIGEAF
jgi:outer membrane protein assembly factor BamA